MADLDFPIATGALLVIEAPDGETVEGVAMADIESFDEPFTIACAETGDLLRVEAPWDCDIFLADQTVER